MEARLSLRKPNITMNPTVKITCKAIYGHHHPPSLTSDVPRIVLRPKFIAHTTCSKSSHSNRKLVGVRACSSSGSEGDGEKQQATERRHGFLSLEEAGLVEISGLDTHERFLCRLTISSLNLLRVISEQEGCSIEELNAGRICDWFLKDKLKREQDIGSAVLQWGDDSDEFQF